MLRESTFNVNAKIDSKNIIQAAKAEAAKTLKKA
jgi:hypothetical protein